MNCTSVTSSDPAKCPQEDWTVQAIVAIYMLFSNFLLVNLVIAMFRFEFYLIMHQAILGPFLLTAYKEFTVAVKMLGKCYL